jgi:YfiH family protein
MGWVGETEVEIVRVAGWERNVWLLHGFSTRVGGVSTVYSAGSGELNLGWTKEDNPACVRENRGRFLRLAGGEMSGNRGMRMVNVRQVHGNLVRVIRAEDGVFEGKLETAEGKAVLEGDGLVTNLPGVMLGVGTADCVPVLVVDVGTAVGIVGEGIEAMQREYGSRPQDLRAAVGPSIGACCYAVGEEVRSEFRERFGYADELFREVAGLGQGSGVSKLYVDLWEANRRQLVDAGVDGARIAVVGECTACAREATGERRYFSHRAEQGVAGRMLNVIGMAE